MEGGLGGAFSCNNPTFNHCNQLRALEAFGWINCACETDSEIARPDSLPQSSSSSSLSVALHSSAGDSEA